jgi:transcriptional regulator with XRE-family HTH domain
MKSMNKQQQKIDPMAEARKNKEFLFYAKEARARIRLGIEVYKTRVALGMSQQELAKSTKTTQKMISNIEHGSVDVRYSTLNKIKESLNFQADNLAKIFDFVMPVKFLFAGGSSNKENTGNIKNLTVTSISNGVLLK